MLLSAILLVQFVAFGGALLARPARRRGSAPSGCVLGSLVVWAVLVVAAYLLQAGAAWQFYLLAVAIALVLGGSQALSRSLFSRLIPAGREAEYFGFYEISDSGTSWLGPLLFGLAYQLTGSYRSALVSLVVFFVVGFVLLVRVPLRGGIDAGRQRRAGAGLSRYGSPDPCRSYPADACSPCRHRRPADSALASMPAAGNRRAIPMPAHLKFFYGPMDCGKSTLALQIDHNHARQGRHGLMLTRYDRSGGPTSPPGSGSATPRSRSPTTWTCASWCASTGPLGRRVDYLIVDEAGFLNPEHVDQLADLVDDYHVDVYCFGLATDFRSQLLPGAKRLIELADEICRDPGRGAVLVRPAGPAERPGGRRPGGPRGRHRGGGRHRRGRAPTRSATRCCAGRTTAAASSARPRSGRAAHPGLSAGRRRTGGRRDVGLSPGRRMWQ